MGFMISKNKFWKKVEKCDCGLQRNRQKNLHVNSRWNPIGCDSKITQRGTTEV